MILKLPSQKGVKHRVNAEIQACDVTGDVLCVQKAAITLCRILILIDHHDDVIRAPEYEKHQDDDENEPHGAMFAYHPRAQDGQRYPGVAVDECTQREDKKQHKLHIEIEEFPLSVAGVFTHQSFHRILFDGEVDEGLNAGEDANDPDDCTQHHGVAASASFVGDHAMHHGQISIEGHEREEEDGAVEA